MSTEARIPGTISIGLETWKRPGYRNFPALCQHGYRGFANDMVQMNPAVAINRVHMDEMWVRTLHEAFPLWVGGQKAERQKRKKLEDALTRYTTCPKVERFWAERVSQTVATAEPAEDMEVKGPQIAFDNVPRENKKNEDEDEDEDEDEVEKMDMDDESPFHEDGREVFEPYEEGMRRKPVVAHGSFRLPGTRHMQMNSAMKTVSLEKAEESDSMLSDIEMDMS